MIRALLILAVAGALSACASVSHQTSELIRNKPDVPEVSRLDVPFVEQSEGYCGPSALRMGMLAQGYDVPLDELVKEVYTPGKGGSLKLDMISAARRHGLMAVQVEGLNSVVQELAAGNPVLVFENLGFKWIPQWHYAVAVGYDLPAQEMILHSGSEKYKREPLTYFEHRWSLADYWAIVILPPGEMSATGGELAHLQAASGLETAGQTEAAEKAYSAMLERWPSSLGVLIGLGNTNFKQRQPDQAVHYLRRAVKAHPDSVIARHNLEIAENALKNRNSSAKLD